MKTLAKAAAIAQRIEGAKQSDSGWWRMPCPAHQGKGQSMAIKDNGEGGLAAKCFSVGCDYLAILHALQDVSGLAICQCQECRGVQYHSKPRARRVAKKTRPQSSKKPVVHHSKKQQGNQNQDKEKQCNSLRAVSLRGPFPTEHPSTLYLQKKEKRHACWAMDEVLPVDFVETENLSSDTRWLVDSGLFRGAAGCLLGSFRMRPGGDPAGVAMVWIDDQGLPVKKKGGTDKLSYWRQDGLVWMDEQEGNGTLFIVEGLIDGVRVRHLLAGLEWARVACTVGSLKNLVGKVRAGGILNTLQGYDRVVLIPDGDKPGRVGARAARHALWTNGMRDEVDILWVEDGHDPASADRLWMTRALLDFKSGAKNQGKRAVESTRAIDVPLPQEKPPGAILDLSQILPVAQLDVGAGVCELCGQQRPSLRLTVQPSWAVWCAACVKAAEDVSVVKAQVV